MSRRPGGGRGGRNADPQLDLFAKNKPRARKRGDWRERHLRCCLACGSVWRRRRRKTCPECGFSNLAFCLTCDRVWPEQEQLLRNRACPQPSENVRRLVKLLGGDWDRARHALTAANGDIPRAFVAHQRSCRLRDTPATPAEVQASHPPLTPTDEKIRDRVDREIRMWGSGRSTSSSRPIPPDTALDPDAVRDIIEILVSRGYRLSGSVLMSPTGAPIDSTALSVIQQANQ